MILRSITFYGASLLVPQAIIQLVPLENVRNKRIENEILFFLVYWFRFVETGQNSATKIQKHTLGELHDPLSIFTIILTIRVAG